MKQEQAGFVRRRVIRDAYDRLKEQVELLRCRIYTAKADRIDATQLDLESTKLIANVRERASV